MKIHGLLPKRFSLLNLLLVVQRFFLIVLIPHEFQDNYLDNLLVYYQYQLMILYILVNYQLLLQPK